MAQAKAKSSTPKQLQKSARAAAKEYEEVYGKPETDKVPPVEEAAPAGEQAPAPAPTVVELAPATPDPAKPVDWEQKYRTLDGKYTAEVPRLQRENSQLMAQASAMEERLKALEAAPAPDEPAPTIKDIEKLLKQEEIDDYGEDMISVVKRAARDEIAPELKKLREENEKLRGNLGHVEEVITTTNKNTLFTDMDKAVPTWREINTDAKFLDWLGQPDVYSGITRQELLTKAFEAQNATQVAKFFKGYLQEQTPVTPGTTETQVVAPAGETNLDTLVAPGRPKGSTDTSGARSEFIWSEATINDFYRDVQKGLFKDREPEKVKLERDIFSAMKEGRVIG